MTVIQGLYLLKQVQAEEMHPNPGNAPRPRRIIDQNSRSHVTHACTPDLQTGPRPWPSPAPTQEMRPVLVHVRGSKRSSSSVEDQGEEFFVHDAPMLLMPGTELLSAEECAGRTMSAVNPKE